ncbi:MAG: family protein 3-like [Rickettsiaceae bacterium]|jgi:hypothetical protein|nr:family protein 3-like [Rickettsiaceae bacterium]
MRELVAYLNKIGEFKQAAKIAQGKRSLKLTSKQLREIKTEDLNHLLTTTPSVKKLNLSSQKLDNGDAALVANLLMLNKTIAIVDLSNNTIQEIGAGRLAKAISTNETVKEFNISGNQIKDIGFEAIGKALKLNNTIEKISFHHNGITDGFSNSFAETMLTEILQSNKTIYNTCSIPSYALNHMLTKNKQLKFEPIIKKIVEEFKTGAKTLTLDEFYSTMDNIDFVGNIIKNRQPELLTYTDNAGNTTKIELNYVENYLKNFMLENLLQLRNIVFKDVKPRYSQDEIEEILTHNSENPEQEIEIGEFAFFPFLPLELQHKILGESDLISSSYNFYTYY